MEYTKDMILRVSYEEVNVRPKGILRILGKISNVITKHKVITAVGAIVIMLMILDIMLIVSFIDALSSV